MYPYFYIYFVIDGCPPGSPRTLLWEGNQGVGVPGGFWGAAGMEPVPIGSGLAGGQEKGAQVSTRCVGTSGSCWEQLLVKK